MEYNIVYGMNLAVHIMKNEEENTWGATLLGSHFTVKSLPLQYIFLASTDRKEGKIFYFNQISFDHLLG